MSRASAMVPWLLLASALHWYESPAVVIDPFTPFGQSEPTTLYLSLISDTGTLVGWGIGGTDVAYADEDILEWNGSYYSLYFDGSAAGLASTVDIGAFDIDEANNRILMSFKSATQTVPDVGTVTSADVVAYDRNTGVFTWLFDGSDVLMTSLPGEAIDALHLLPTGNLVISVQGTPSLGGITGILDEDLIRFAPTSLGDVTTGAWNYYFDGSDVGLDTDDNEDVTGFAAWGSDLYLSTLGAFGVPGTPTLTGSGEDIWICRGATTGTDTACSSLELYFDGSANGLTANDVDAFDLQ